MYPEREDGPTFRPTTSINLAAMMRQDLEDEAAIEEAEEWTRLHPMTPQTHLNLAFIEVGSNVVFASQRTRDD